MNTTETLPFPFHTEAWEATHNQAGKFVGEDRAVAIIAHLLERLAEAEAKN